MLADALRPLPVFRVFLLVLSYKPIELGQVDRAMTEMWLGREMPTSVKDAGRVVHKRGRNPERIRSRLMADKQGRINKLVLRLVKEPVAFGNKRYDFLLSFFHKVLIAPPILGSTGVMTPKD